MELSEEVKKKAEEFYMAHPKQHSDLWWFWGDYIHDAYAGGYQQALEDVKAKEDKHRRNMMEIGMKTMSGDIYNNS